MLRSLAPATAFLALVVFVAACRGASREGNAEGSAGATAETVPEEEKTTPVGAIAEAQRVEIRAALRELQKALLTFRVLNDRYPADEAELASDPETSAAWADVRAGARAVRYAAQGPGYTLEVVPRTGAPLRVEGGEPMLRR